MKPELPFLAAGAVAIAGGAIAEHHWPTNANKAIIGTVVLVVVASATTNTRAASLVHAFGMLTLIVAFLAAGKQVQESKNRKS